MGATVASVAASLPWKTIIAALPEVVRAAKALGKMWESRPKPVPVDPGESMDAQLAAVRERLQTLEENELAQSEVVTQIAEQLGGVAAGIRELSARQSRLERYLVGLGVLTGVALLVAASVAIVV